MQNIAKKEWEKQVHAALQMTRSFTKDEQYYHLSKWYEVGFDIETIKLAYSYLLRKNGSWDWHTMTLVLGWIRRCGVAEFKLDSENLES